MSAVSRILAVTAGSAAARARAWSASAEMPRHQHPGCNGLCGAEVGFSLIEVASAVHAHRQAAQARAVTVVILRRAESVGQ